MKYDWIDSYLTEKNGVTKDIQEEWNWIRYHIGGKMFAAVCRDDDNNPYYFKDARSASVHGRLRAIVRHRYSFHDFPLNLARSVASLSGRTEQ